MSEPVQYELEVADVLGAWGYGGRWYKPGVYVVTDPALVEAAQDQPGVSVHALSEGETAEEERYGPADQPPGPLTQQDLRQPAGPRTCASCGGAYMKKHRCLKPPPDPDPPAQDEDDKDGKHEDEDPDG